jgi:putative transposase
MNAPEDPVLKARRKCVDPCMTFHRLSVMGQSLHQVYGHLVFSTKDRRNLIGSEIEAELYQYICGMIRDLGSKVIVINGMPDHLHIIFRASKSVSDVEFIKQVKGSSSKWLGDKVKDFRWQKGYGWFSVGAKDLDKAVAYVKGQKEHHKSLSFQDELRGILRTYDIDFDERYLWD